MGDTTGQAAKDAADYASELSAMIGVEDESIMAAQAQLATFGAVSDETARAAGIFDRATAAAADLAAAGFGSLDANSVQLGKALQDPTKGMTALAKSGVTFTKAQKEQIKAMQESGDLLGAQKMILAAVEGQVQGTAAATATSTAKMSVKFGELQETIGAQLLPVVDTLAGFLTKYMDLLIPLGAAILGVVVAIKAWQVATTAMTVAQQAWTAAQVVFNAVMAANPIFLVVAAIAALIAIVVVAYMKVGWFRNMVDTAMRAIKTAFFAMRDAAKAVFDWLKANWPLLLAIITGPIGVAVLAVVKNWDTIKAAVAAVFNWIKANWPLLLAILTGPIGLATKAIIDNWDTIKQAATDVYEWVAGKFEALAGAIGAVLGAISRTARAIADAIKAPINAVIRGWNSIEFKVPSMDPLGSFGPSIGGQTIGLPDIPTLQRGGRVLTTGLAVVHEGETFSGVGGRNAPQQVHIHINTTGLGARAPDIQRAVVDALRLYTSRNGPLTAPIVAAG
jgi:hypothetical protein